MPIVILHMSCCQRLISLSFQQLLPLSKTGEETQPLPAQSTKVRRRRVHTSRFPVFITTPPDHLRLAYSQRQSRHLGWDGRCSSTRTTPLRRVNTHVVRPIWLSAASTPHPWTFRVFTHPQYCEGRSTLPSLSPQDHHGQHRPQSGD